jgi:hypothetical protein
VHALRSAASDLAKEKILNAIYILAFFEFSRSALVAAGACEACAHYLKSAASGDAKAACCASIVELALSDDGRRILCEAVAQALRSASSDHEKTNVAYAMCSLAKFFENRRALVAAGAGEAAVQALRSAGM